MRIVVAVQRVVDCNVKVRVKSADTGVGVAQAERVPELIDAI